MDKSFNRFVLLSPEELEALKEKQIFLSPVIDGRQEISVDALGRWWYATESCSALYSSEDEVQPAAPEPSTRTSIDFTESSEESIKT